ncbi:MAG: hypothetical protein V2I33_00600, partial [Kangiellaceae bacterium]|nr:hypothetical protein [Kangiellaceae bacterium]
MHNLKVTLLTAFALGSFSIAQAANLPVAYDVIVLDALETVPIDGNTVSQASYGYSINSSGQAVGASFGKYSYVDVIDTGDISYTSPKTV